MRTFAIVERQQSADSSYLAVAKISVLVPGSWPASCSMNLPPSPHPMLTTGFPHHGSRSASASSASRLSSSSPDSPASEK
jgi:hypothetical protein